MATLSALYCYPVKSCRGVPLQEAVLDARGIAHDREFLIVDAQDRFLTQRGTPAMALIETALTPAALVLRGPDGGEWAVPWEEALPAAGPARRQVTVWQDTLLADDMGDGAAGWLGQVLGQRCRLVRIGASCPRGVLRRVSPSVKTRRAKSPSRTRIPCWSCRKNPWQTSTNASTARPCRWIAFARTW